MDGTSGNHCNFKRIYVVLELIPRDQGARDDNLQDPFMQQIKSATTAEDVFNIVDRGGKQLQLPQIISSMKSLFELQKKEM